MRVLLLPVAALLSTQLTKAQDLKTGLMELPALHFTKKPLGNAPFSPLRWPRQPLTFARVPKPSLRTAFIEVHYDAGKTALLCQRTRALALPLPRPGGFNRTEGLRSSYFKTTNTEILPVALQPEKLLAAMCPAHAEALTANTRQQQLNLEQEGDVFRLLAYHNAL